MDALGYQNKNHRAQSSGKYQTPCTEKKRKWSKQEAAVRRSSLMRTETASHWFSLKAVQPRVWKSVMSPNWWVVWNLPPSRSHGAWELLASSLVSRDFCRRVLEMITKNHNEDATEENIGWRCPRCALLPRNDGFTCEFVLQAISHEAIYLRTSCQNATL